jgi:hypothetical protein
VSIRHAILGLLVSGFVSVSCLASASVASAEAAAPVLTGTVTARTITIADTSFRVASARPSVDPSISGTLAPGTADEYGPYYEYAYGTIVVSLNWTPTGAPMEVAFCDSSNNCVADPLSGGSGTASFTPQVAGDYTVYVINNSTSDTVTYSGSISY